MSKRAPKMLLLAPGQWKIIDGIKVHNLGTKIMRVHVIIAEE